MCFQREKNEESTFKGVQLMKQLLLWDLFDFNSAPIGTFKMGIQFIAALGGKFSNSTDLTET